MKKNWLYFVLFFIGPIIVVFWMMGAFNSATIEIAQRGPYHYAYLEHVGRYDKLIDKQNRVYQILKEQNIASHAPISVLQSDPETTPKKDLHSQAGYLLDPGAQAREPLLMADIPSRRVLVVRVKANPVLAPSIAYKALTEYLKTHQMKLVLPTVEIYQDKGLTVEMDM